MAVEDIVYAQGRTFSSSNLQVGDTNDFEIIVITAIKLYHEVWDSFG